MCGGVALFPLVLLVLFISFTADFLYYPAFAVGLELFGGTSSLFPSFPFVSTHHLGVTPSPELRRGRSRRVATAPLQRLGRSWRVVPADVNVSKQHAALAQRVFPGIREAGGRQVGWCVPS